MKQILSILIMAAVFASCSKQEDLDTLPQGGTPLTISVTDGGYTDSNPRTRSVENGYLTEFTAGDQIGLYVVKPDGSYAHKNIPLTLSDNGGGTPMWQALSGTTLYYEGAAAKYFTYYPYQSTVNGTPNPTATTASDFFADVVTQWSPSTDQSTHAKYTAQDLMIGKGKLDLLINAAGNYTVRFPMTHTMALVVIETPTTKYTFTNNTPSIPDYYIPAPNTKFHGFTPCYIDGQYRLLVKPAQSGAAELYGSYAGASGNTKEYAVSPNGIGRANYVCYKVDGGVTSKDHTLQVGDFYLKDGSLVGKDENLTIEQQVDCIGIVLKVGKDNSGNWKDDCNYTFKDSSTPMPTIHGYVLGLYDAKDENGNTSFQWGSSDKQVEHTDMNREETGFYGYKNTNAIKAFAAAKGKALQTDFPATYYATVGYEAQFPAPANSSGWFLPSAGQGKYWLNNRNVILESVQKATGADSYNWKDYYWLSSENDGNPARYAWRVRFYNGSVFYNDKSNGYDVRSIFAF